jgi:hypothetical protein
MKCPVIKHCISWVHKRLWILTIPPLDWYGYSNRPPCLISPIPLKCKCTLHHCMHGYVVDTINILRTILCCTDASGHTEIQIALTRILILRCVSQINIDSLIIVCGGPATPAYGSLEPTNKWPQTINIVLNLKSEIQIYK